MKKIIISLICMIFLIGLVSADMEYFQKRLDMGNGTLKNHIFTMYSKGGFGTADYIKGDNPYELYFLANSYIQTWNSQNTFYKIRKCEINISILKAFSNNSNSVHYQNFTSLDADQKEIKYFVQLHDGDSVSADGICYFENTSYDFNKGLYMPLEIQLVSPTWECKACQLYENSLLSDNVAKSKTIGDHIVTISDYIKKLFMINFEIVLALFWLSMIMLLFTAISFIFLIAYYLYAYLRRVGK